MQPKNHQWAVGDVLEMRYANTSFGSAAISRVKQEKIGNLYRVTRVAVHGAEGQQSCTVEALPGNLGEHVGKKFTWFAWRFEKAEMADVAIPVPQPQAVPERNPWVQIRPGALVPNEMEAIVGGDMFVDHPRPAAQEAPDNWVRGLKAGDMFYINGLDVDMYDYIPEDMIMDINNNLCRVFDIRILDGGVGVDVYFSTVQDADKGGGFKWIIYEKELLTHAVKVDRCGLHELAVGDVVYILKLVDEAHLNNGLRVGIGDRMREHEYKHATVTVAERADGVVKLDIDAGRYVWNPGWFIKALNAKPQIAIRPAQGKLFKIGDHVVIANKGEGYPKWVEEQDACLYELGKIKQVDEQKKLYLIASFSGEWWYAHSSVTTEEEFVKKGGEVKKPNNSVLSLAIADWRKKVRESANCVANYALFFRSKKTGLLKVCSHIGDVCHARLNKEANVSNTHYDIEAVVDYPLHKVHERNIGDNMPTYRKYVDYIVNRSPWAVAFKGKTVKNILENGVELNLDATSGQVVGGATALRMGTEYYVKLPAFQWALDKGFTENQAFMFGWFLNYEPKTNKFRKGSVDGGHNALSGAMNADIVWKFFNKGFPDLQDPPYRTDPNNYKVFRAVGDDCYYGGHGKGGYTLIHFLNEHAFKKAKQEFGAVNAMTEDEGLEFLQAIAKVIQ